MAWQALLPYIPMAYGAIKSMFGKDPDPQGQSREMMLQTIRELKERPDVMKGQIMSQSAVARANAMRDMENRAASANVPDTVRLQAINNLYRTSISQLHDALMQNEQLRGSNLQDIARLQYALPPEQPDLSGPEMLGLGLELLSMGWGQQKPMKTAGGADMPAIAPLEKVGGLGPATSGSANAPMAPVYNMGPQRPMNLMDPYYGLPQRRYRSPSLAPLTW
ncbi:MAG: hypothetical protein PHV97_00125 [Candidatus Omnitrophica bacterium]|nr:hypothetical protein [Candidatus Omnitrophota bacterium]